VKACVPHLRIDLHLHTNYSRDANTTLEEAIHYAKKKQLDGIAVTDHDTVEGARRLAKEQSILVIPGIEVSSRHGHILGLNITEPIPPRLSIVETVERIRLLGGLAVIAHPSVVIKTGLGTRIDSASGIDAVEVINASALPFSLSTYLSHRLALRLRLPETGGSDSHYPDEIGSAYTIIDADPNRDDVIEAIRKGRTEPVGKPISWMNRLGRGTENLRRVLRGNYSSKHSI
jgi:predicted metal-dependent phosphoesterase TrpH